MDIKKEKNIILEEFLKNVPFDGWNDNCLKMVSKKIKEDENFAFIFFPKGAQDLLVYFSDTIDDKMEKWLEENQITPQKIREKIHFLTMLRLEFYKPYKEAIRKLQTANVKNIPNSIKILWKTSDNFWNYIGDESTDFNYYSKRFLLSCVFSRTLLYWLADNTEESQDTSIFLEREIGQVLKLGNFKSHCKKVTETISKVPFLRLIFKKNKI